MATVIKTRARPAPPDRLNAHPREWTYADAQAAVAYAITSTVGDDGYAENEAIAEWGDHWRDGVIVPPVGDPALRAGQLKRLESMQAPVDTLNEVLDNAVNGLLGTEAAITFPLREPVPEPEYEDEDVEGAADRNRERRAAYEAAVKAAKQRADAMHAAISTMWDRVALWEHARRAHRRSRWAGRSTLHAWVPRENPDDPLPTGLSFKAALEHIALDSPAPNAAHVFVQPRSQRRVAVILFKSEQGEGAEVWYVDGRETVCRVVGVGDAAPRAEAREDGKDPSEVVRLALGGWLPLSEMTADVLLREATRKQQDALDMDGITHGRVMQSAGFRARYTLNAQPTGEWSTTPPTESPPLRTQEVGGVTYYLIETPRIMGPSTALDLTGELVEETSTSATGERVMRRSLATPGVHVEEPVDPEFTIKSQEHRRRVILRDCKQGHLAMVGTAEASGTAYEQARAVHQADLENQRPPLERALRDIITYIIALADLMTADTDPLKGFLDAHRVAVQARVNPGPLTPAERQAIRDDWAAGLISLQTAMARLGIEDVGAEVEALEQDPMVRLKLVAQYAETMAAVASIPGVSVEAAARALKAAGLAPEIVDALVPRDTDGLVDDDAPRLAA